MSFTINVASLKYNNLSIPVNWVKIKRHISTHKQILSASGIISYYVFCNALHALKNHNLIKIQSNVKKITLKKILF